MGPFRWRSAGMAHMGVIKMMEGLISKLSQNSLNYQLSQKLFEFGF